ncbi:hypothetical protein AB0N31_23650 [Streptomyces sp. NPDC051051]|uniref:hypothetical protein n=1 Tax=Streptomyces sp. NPDC051051 TaxID=3155666 RepID=UPI00343C13AE
MDRRGRTLRLTATAALVVLALTGFSTGRGHGSSTHGGGGCSSSSQDHDGSSGGGGSSSSGSSGYHDYDDDDYDYGDGSGGSSGSDGSSSPAMEATFEPATVELVSCATKDRPYATVEVVNPNGVPRDFDVAVYFMDADTVAIDEAHPTVNVPANGTKRVRVEFDGGAPGEVLDHCEAAPTAPDSLSGS